MIEAPRLCPSCGADLLLATAAAEAASGHEQSLADSDQTASDHDQTWSEHDQTVSDRDQQSSDQDQHASDDDLAAGGDRAVHDKTAQARSATTRERQANTGLRDLVGAERLHTAAARDAAAELRDRDAEHRDSLSARLLEHQGSDTAGSELQLQAERDRARAAADRAQAAADRSRAASEREQAATERAEALQLRAEAEAAVQQAATDQLTGARTRSFGLEEIERELERARRTGGTLTLAFVDVNGLKQVNDRDGHLAGDALLRRTSQTLRAHVRSYDLLVRYGGDEFVCAMPNATPQTAQQRFQAIDAALAAVDADHSITYGLAEAEPTDNLHDLIARADTQLLNTRSTRASSRTG
jgi:diguanylate cyclase (GGDEF)-like protein